MYYVSDYRSSVIYFDVYASDMVFASQLSQQVQLLQTEVRELNNQVSEQEASITQLSEELAQTTSALQTSAATINLGKSYDEVQQRQKAILNYINCITVMTL